VFDRIKRLLAARAQQGGRYGSDRLRLQQLSPEGNRRSLRDIARELAASGYTNKRGVPYSASCAKSMVTGPAHVL
jgi:hypothetical protein